MVTIRTSGYTATDIRTARLAKALAHPARVAILRVLLNRNACVCGDIVEELPLAQSTVSQHLKVLKEAGLIQGTIDGPSVCYCADPLAVEAAMAALRGLLGEASASGAC
jgi:DNA-binding transcriptional ArsR family regulator